MKTSTSQKTRKLSLSKESLRKLTSTDLTAVVGASGNPVTCVMTVCCQASGACTNQITGCGGH
jgi:hypothetical protein